MLRNILFPKIHRRHPGFHLRGHEVKRIETLSDAVFAFAVTLLIVSLEVPKSFEDLITTMRGFFSFGICFAILMLIWYEQYIFFRRYGIDDTITVALNSMLLFIVLFYVYPLKFLFTVIFANFIYGPGKSPFTITMKQVPHLIVIYGVGFMIIYSIFTLLYIHAHRNRVFLQLTTLESFDTRSKIYSQIVLIGIGALSIMAALTLPPAKAGYSGMVYGLNGVALSIFNRKRKKMRSRIYHENDPTITST
jgi:uncharacterized membrane protein